MFKLLKSHGTSSNNRSVKSIIQSWGRTSETVSGTDHSPNYFVKVDGICHDQLVEIFRDTMMTMPVEYLEALLRLRRDEETLA